MGAEDPVTDLEAEVAADTKANAVCSVCEWIEGRVDAAVWERMMAAPVKRYGHVALYNAMRRRGFTPQSSKPIENHRRRGHRGPA